MENLVSTQRTLHLHREPCVYMESLASTWRSLRLQREPCVHTENLASTQRSLPLSGEACLYTENLVSTQRTLHLQREPCVYMGAVVGADNMSMRSRKQTDPRDVEAALPPRGLCSETSQAPAFHLALAFKSHCLHILQSKYLNLIS